MCFSTPGYSFEHSEATTYDHRTYFLKLQHTIVMYLSPIAMEIRKLSPELLTMAIKELNEDPKRIDDDLTHFRDWLEKQRHLTIRQDDQLLMSFLRGCKWSLQKAKYKIDDYYTIRSMIPEWFTNKDPLLPEIQKVLEAGILLPLPHTNLNGRRVLYCNLSNADPEIYVDDLIKVFYMMIDILIKEDDTCVVAGFEIISIYGNVPLSIMMQITPSCLKKQIMYMRRGCPIRSKNLYVINPHPLIVTLTNTVIKPFLSKKMIDRIHYYSLENDGTLPKDADKSIFPKELGGHNGSLAEIKDTWKAKVENYRDWFLEDVKYGSNEKLRIGPSKTYKESFGLEGTFRKLTID